MQLRNCLKSETEKMRWLKNLYEVGICERIDKIERWKLSKNKNHRMNSSQHKDVLSEEPQWVLNIMFSLKNKSHYGKNIRH